MSAGRTEPPTPRRLREARRRGDVARSRELPAAAALLAGILALAATAGGGAPALARSLRASLQVAAGASPPDAVAILRDAALARSLRASLQAAAGASPPDAVAILRDAALAVARLAAPSALAALAAATLASVAVSGASLAPGALRPRWDRVDPVLGLRRLASPAALLGALLGLAKAAALALVGWSWLRGEAPGLAALPRADPAALLRAAPAFADLALRLAAVALASGLADAALARARHRRALRMTRDEVRREQKEDEGDPSHRAERRRRHRALLEAGPLSRATVVVVNPSHLAVALRHDRRGEDAPRLLAKGAGREARAIRSAARRAGVPIVREVPLARALFQLAEVGEEIPEELYDAAAAVLAHLYAARPEDRP